MSILPLPAPLNRREWLKATGVTLAGVVLASRLPGSAAPRSAAQREPSADEPAQSPGPRDERRYIHGFEPYPGA